jgi:hypothetical protein
VHDKPRATGHAFNHPVEYWDGHALSLSKRIKRLFKTCLDSSWIRCWRVGERLLFH